MQYNVCFTEVKNKASLQHLIFETLFSFFQGQSILEKAKVFMKILKT